MLILSVNRCLYSTAAIRKELITKIKTENCSRYKNPVLSSISHSLESPGCRREVARVVHTVANPHF